MTLANDLVQFLMHLFGNRQAAQDFLDNPEKVLEDHGFGEVCSADVDAAMPVVLDYAPVTTSRFDREYNTGGNTSWTGHIGGGGGGAGGTGHTPPAGGGSGGGHHDHDDHAHAVQQLHHVVNNYSYTSTVDDRDNIVDQSVNQNIWAEGDVEQWFDNDSVIASGDRSVAAGDDAYVRDSNNISDSNNTDNSADNSTDNSVHAGGDVNIGNEKTDIDDSFNTDLDVDVADSFNDNSDNSVNHDMDVAVEDSFNDNSDNSDNSDHSVDNTDNSTDVAIEDSFNEDSSTNTDVDVALEDSFNDNSTTETNTTEVAIEDSFQDNSETEMTHTEDNSTNTDVYVEDIEVNTAIDDSVAG